ncbi:unnamed protein product, partial [Acidocella sp. C78]
VPDKQRPDMDPTSPAAGGGDVTEQLIRLMSRDLVFTMTFLGESQHRMQTHFESFITASLARAGMNQTTHPMIRLFVERHATLLREFVFSGVALSRQFGIGEIEHLIGDASSLLRIDIWDQLRNHIEMAETRFRAQIPDLPGQLADFAAPDAARGEAP